MLPESIDPIPPHIPGEYRIRLADSAWEYAEFARLRRAVFCQEQRIFNGDDRDDDDTIAVPIVALACIAGIGERVVGAVRIHQESQRIWVGSRLCVASDSRRLAFLSWGLIRLAVGTAKVRGCERFLAHVQEQNVALFEKLHWHALAPVTLHGRAHWRMEADLAHYPPCFDGELRPMPLLRLVA